MVTIYTTPNCVMCNATKRQMKKLNIDFEEKAMTEDKVDEFRKLGMTSAPVVRCGDDLWCGYRPDKLKKIANGGEDGGVKILAQVA